jgi:hypothetical protein
VKPEAVDIVGISANIEQNVSRFGTKFEMGRGRIFEFDKFFVLVGLQVECHKTSFFFVASSLKIGRNKLECLNWHVSMLV